ncbi:hypothetical protein [Sulfitobacter mediterraneus]|nr:hypothetical protein [Sulfitobacter mediterraneus]
MAERFNLANQGKTWHIMARKGAGAATEALWLSLGGCPDQIVATRVFLVHKAREALK